MLILLIILINIKVFTQNSCIAQNSKDINKCLFCKFGFYYENNYNITANFINIQKCIPNIDIEHKRNIFINENSKIDDLEGTIEKPYKSLAEAFINENNMAKKNNINEIIFNLIGNHSFYSLEKFHNLALFRRINLTLTIRPVYCQIYNISDCFQINDSKPIINIKSNDFGFFISNKLIIENLIFSSNKFIYINNELIYGFLNLETIVEIENKIIPNILIINCDFFEFEFYSLITIQDEFPINIMIKNCRFERFSFQNNIISKKKEEYIYYIVEDQNFTLMNKEPILNLEGFIDFNDNIFKNTSSNQIQSKIYLFLFNNFSEIIKFHGNKFINIFYIDCIFFISNSNFYLTDSIFENNQMQTIFEILNARYISLYNFKFTNNSLNYFIKISHTSLLLSNIIINSTILPMQYFILLVESELILENCHFLNLNSLTIYYLIFSESFIYTSIDIQMKTSDYPEPSFAKDSIIILNCSYIELYNISLLSNFASILSLKLINTLLKNIFLKSQSFILIQTERFLNITNVLVKNYFSEAKFLYLTYTRNISISNMTVFNCIVLIFFDVYSITAISDLDIRKTSFIISDCNFSNIILKSFQPTHFTFINYYTLYHGFYSLLLINNIFNDIYSHFYSDDNLFFFATGYHNIINCSFLDISNLTLFRLYSRVSSSEVIIYNSNFLITKNRLARFYYVSISYNIGFAIIKNSIFYCKNPIILSYSIELLQVQNLIFINNTFSNIKSLSGGAIRLHLYSLKNTLIENCLFLNNSGFNNNGADLILLVTNNENNNFRKDFFKKMQIYGIINSRFIGSDNSGSITLLDGGELLLFNCTFINIIGYNGAILNIGNRCNVGIYLLLVNNSKSQKMGGCFFMSQSNLTMINSSFNNVSSDISGGILNGLKQSIIIIENSDFNNMSSNEGAGFNIIESILDLKNCKLKFAYAKLQGAFFNLRKMKIIANDLWLENGTALTGAAIQGESITFDFYNLIVLNCKSSLDKGLGTLFFSGINENTNFIKNLYCSKNNAMTGACIYAKDIIITLLNIIINDNIGKEESILVSFEASLKAKIDIKNGTIYNNIAGISILQCEFGDLILNSTHFSNNFFNKSLILLNNGYFQTFDSIYTNNENFISSILYLIEIKSGGNISISLSELNGQNKYGLLKITQTLCIVLINSNFSNSISESGSVLSAKIINQILIIECIFKENLAFKYGGTLFFIELKDLIIKSSRFYDNLANTQGSHIYFYNSKGMVNSIINISSTIFFNSNNSALYINNVIILIERCFFSGNSFYSSVCINSINSNEITIINSTFGNFKDLGTLKITNYFTENVNCLLYNNIFLNSYNIESGGFFYSEGKFNWSFIQNTFTNGSTENNGGAIALFCLDNKCKLNFTNFNFFNQNTAKKSGGAIFSSKTEIILLINSVVFVANNVKNKKKLNKFLKANLGNNVFSFPSKIILLELNDIEALEKLTSTISINNLSSSNEIRTKSGYYLNLGIIVTDNFDNIIATDSTTLYYFKYNQGLSSNKLKDHIILENNIAKLNKGIGIFTKISIVGNPGNYTLTITSESDEVQKDIILIINPCGRGDIINQLRCIRCNKDFYSLNPLKYEQCAKCPNNAKCPGGDKIIPNIGYWRFDEDNTLIVECWYSQACPYQFHYENSTSDKFNFKCQEGYWGNLCFNCDLGYGKGYIDCFKCDNHGYYTLFIVQITFLLFMSILESYLTLQNARSTTKTLIKIFFYHNAFLMTITEINYNVSSEMKELFGIINDRATLTPSNIFNYYCFIKNFVVKEDLFRINLGVQIFVPIIYTTLVLIAKTFTDLAYAAYKNINYSFFKQTRVNAIIIFFISYRNWYPRVILYSILVFQCSNIGPDKYVNQNPNIKCWSNDHFGLLLGYSLPSIGVWAIGIPLFTYYIIKKKNLEINLIESENHNLKIVAKNLSKQHPKLNALYFFLVSDYKITNLYWQVVEFFILTICFFVSQIVGFFDDLVRSMILFIVYAVFFMIYLKIEPYRDNLNSYFMCFSFTICIFTLIFDVIGNNEGNDYYVRVFAKNFILAINLMFYCSFGVAISKRYYDQNKRIVNKIIEKLKNIQEKKGLSDRKLKSSLESIIRVYNNEK